MPDTNEQKWIADFNVEFPEPDIMEYCGIDKKYHWNSQKISYLAARKKAHSENEDAFRAFTLDLADRYENKIEKRDKLLGKYFRIIKKYRSYLSEDDDEIIHEANKDYEELKK